MSEWQPISTAPRVGWIMVRDKFDVEFAAIAHDEDGWWEDETGDYCIEAAHNNGLGLTEWRLCDPGFIVSDFEGSDRHAEPIYR